MKGNNFVKKIICIVVVFTMLVSNFISPVISIANELNESEKANITETNVEPNNNNEGGEEQTAGEPTTDESNSVDETQAKIDEIEAAFEASQEKDNEQEPKENEDDNDKESKEQIEDNEESNNLIENQDQTQPSNAKGAKKSAPVLRGANNQSSEAQSDKIEDRITPDIIDEVTVKTKNDAYEINSFSTEFVSGATKDENNNLVWTPTSSAAGHEFRFRINYALSGLKEHPAEAIKITIPKQILRNRDGNFADKYEMSLPTDKEYDGTTEFAYIENGDYIVIYNPDPVKAAVNGYIEVSYSTNTSTINYRDYDKTNTDLVTNGGTASDPFNAVITIKTTVRDTEDILVNVSDDKNVFIDTIAKIQSTQKYQPTIYKNWDPSWMVETPADSDQYFYLVWQVVTTIQAGTQPYTFSLQDTITNLTEETSAEDYQFVGYKLSGERYFSGKNMDTTASTGTLRTDYVLTRHKKSTFAGINYKLKNTVTATVNPLDHVDQSTNATSSSTFSWSSEFRIPTGHFDLYKYGNNNWSGRYWDYANYDLDKLQSGEVNELKGFKYLTSMVGYAWPWTVKEGGSSNNPQDYGYNPVNYDTWDDTLYLENDENPMNYEDYYLEYFTYSISNQDASYDDFYNRFDTIQTTYANDETITFYGKFADGQDWIQIGTLNLNTKEITVNDTYVQSMTADKVTFKEGVHATGWRYTTTNKHYYTGISVTPYFVLTNSAYVMEKITNKDKIQIKNIVKTNITDYKNETIFEAERAAIDYARVTYYDSKIEKTVTAGSNNVVKKRYDITWKVNAKETATGGNGDTEYIRQDSGKFYDLIPAGGEIDLNSIQVQTEKGFLPENEYTYETIPNYNNSGRTMLIINIDEQAQYYTVYYKTVHSWESMHDFGRNVLNPVAYETGNEKITKGFPDNGGSLSEENKALFTDLDNTTDANKFIYAEQPHNINALTATVSGLYKKVKSAKDTDYKYDTKVESNGEYSYQLRYQNTFMNKSKNLILFDSLENFEIVDSDAGITKTSGWKGTLQAVDVSQLKQKGIAPVIYISTQDNLNLEEHNDLADTSIWKKVTLLTDLSEAKAIAIDATKDTDGNDYLLEPGNSISATLNMKAPAEISEQAEQNPYAYNNIYLKGTLLDYEEEVSDFLIHQDYTTIKYYIIADVPLVKVNEENTDERIKGITFRLWGTSNYGTDVDALVTSDKNGRITFKDIELGEYKLQEYETNDDWFMDYTEHQVIINRDREVYVDGELVNGLIPFVATNKPRIHADVEFKKKNLVTKAPLEGVKFKLSGTSEYGNEVLSYQISDQNGKVSFKDLEYGTYELIEINTLEGYIPNNDKYKVVVDENGNYDVQKTTSTMKPITKTRYSHTSNINNSGYALGKDTGETIIDTVIIPGSTSLNVTVYYGTYTDHYDWVSVYGGDSTPTYNNYDSSISGKLGGGQYAYNTINAEGYENVCRKWTGTIDGDTVKFYYQGSFGAYMSECYGYYAIITSDIMEAEDIYESIYNKGSYDIYNEPYHSFSFIKKDEYSGENIVGAKFRLYGVSDYGSRVDKQATSSSIGFVEFSGLEPGTYILQETYVPEVIDNQGNTISYVLNDNKYVVNIEKDKTVTINGINKNEYGEYVFYNKRNKGQITIIKKWVDQNNNDQRTEPVIHISNNKPDASEKVQYLRDNYNSSYGPLYYVSSNYRDEITGTFARNKQLTEEDVINLGATRIDKDFDDEDAKYKIYAWIDNEGNCWWWSNADVIKMTDNSNRLFYNMSKIKSIDLSGIDTSEMTNMKEMFYYCSSLTELDTSKLNTSQVTSMSNMFENCYGLIELDVSKFDTRNVETMTGMFRGCSNLETLDLSKFDTSNVKSMRGMFSKCSRITELDLSNFYAPNVTDTSSMFETCRSLTSIDLSNLRPSCLQDMRYMFRYCNNLEEINIDNFAFNVSYLYMNEAFAYCQKLKTTCIDSLDLSEPTRIHCTGLYSNCTSLTEVDFSKKNFSKIISMGGWFNNCTNLKTANFSGVNVSKLTSTDGMFSHCSSLEQVDFSGVNVSKLTSMESMFSNCSSLEQVDLQGTYTVNVTSMTWMFENCSSLKEIDISWMYTTKLTSVGYMFQNCTSLETIWLGSTSDLNMSRVASTGKMFDNCVSLVGGNGTTYNSSYTDKTYARIDKPGTPGYFTLKTASSGSTNNMQNNIQTASTLNNIKDVLGLNNVSTEITKTNLNKPIKLLAPETTGGDESNDGSSETITYSTAETNYDDEGNEVHWVKDGDTWTYTFYVDDPYATWYVWEDELDGYNTNYDISNPGTVENQTATVINYIPEKENEVTIEFGKLSISKTLILRGESGNTTLTSDDDNTEFTFTVKLTAETGKESAISGTKVFGDYVFKDGVSTVKLHAGESVTINGLPAGVVYRVTEKEINGYEAFAGANGTIVKDETSTVEAINYKDKTEDDPTPGTEEKFVSFAVAKQVTGNGEVDEQYTIEIVLDNLKPDTRYTLSNGETFVSDSIGSANITVSLGNNESIIVQNIPVGAKYKVYEHAGDYISSYVITDANNAGLINNTAKNNTKENIDLSTNTETADEGENVTITFTNKKVVTQNLKVQKTVTDSEDTNSYIFEIVFANLEEGTSFNSTVGKITEEDGKAELTIYLAGGEEAEFYNIPVGTTYVVKELASTAIASYTITDANGGNNIVSSSKANTAARKALSTERETINQGEEATVTFINDTVNQEPDSVSASLGVTKKVVDADGENVNNCNETFTFELKAEDDANPMPEKTSVEIKGNGEASFGTITFDSVGTYTYTVVEKAGTNEECTYDNTVYTIVYEVTNAEGLLEITKTVKKNGFIGDVVEFTNIMPKEDEPDNPVNPDKPDEPVTPDEPGKPDEPTTPDEPITPNEPSEPDEPTNPDKPEQPEEPENKDEEKPTPTPDKPNSPQTGDNIIIAVVIGMLAIMVFIVTKKKSKRCNGKHF